MQGVQILGLIIFGIGLWISSIQWSGSLIITIALITIYALYNIFSLIFIVTGLLTKKEKKEKGNYY